MTDQQDSHNNNGWGMLLRMFGVVTEAVTEALSLSIMIAASVVCACPTEALAEA